MEKKITRKAKQPRRSEVVELYGLTHLPVEENPFYEKTGRRVRKA